MKEYEWYLKDLELVKKNNYKVFSCFSCGGGSTMGYKLAGYDVIGNCEIDKKINDMYIKNHKPIYNYCMSIQEMNSLKSFPEDLKKLDILDGSPPCSTFSIAGEREKNWGKRKKFREGQAYQILDDLFFEFIKLAKKLRPKIIVAENVKGIIMGNAKGYVNLIIKQLAEAGYNTQIFLLNAARMGVPQKRERVFFIAVRSDLDFPKINLEFNEEYITYGEIKDTEYKLINKDTLLYKRWLKRNKRDNSLCDTIKRTENGKNSCFNIQFVKDERIPNTLVSGSSFLRFDVPATISDRDIKLIQTFPQDYNFCGQNVQYVCGMSVPPIMMKKIAKEIQIQLLDKLKK